jgi:hypothetical protein
MVGGSENQVFPEIVTKKTGELGSGFLTEEME